MGKGSFIWYYLFNFGLLLINATIKSYKNDFYKSKELYNISILYQIFHNSSFTFIAAIEPSISLAGTIIGLFTIKASVYLTLITDKRSLITQNSIFLLKYTLIIWQ